MRVYFVFFFIIQLLDKTPEKIFCNLKKKEWLQYFSNTITFYNNVADLH